MFTSGSSRRRRVAATTVVLLQVAILCMSLLGPAFVSAAEPSADPSATPPPSTEPSAEPSADPSADPSAAPTAEPTAEPTADPTPAPTPDPTAAPTAEPTAAPTQEPAPSYVPTGPPSIASDQADYPPGGTVTLTGSNWFAGEIVHIFVNDDFGSSWSRNVDVIADAQGQVSDSFDLPNWFVAIYRILATGAQSGGASATFTDASLVVTRGPTGNPPNITFDFTAQLCNQFLHDR
jgi:hypothetical protein